MEEATKVRACARRAMAGLVMAGLVTSTAMSGAGCSSSRSSFIVAGTTVLAGSAILLAVDAPDCEVEDDSEDCFYDIIGDGIAYGFSRLFGYTLLGVGTGFALSGAVRYAEERQEAKAEQQRPTYPVVTATGAQLAPRGTSPPGATPPASLPAASPPAIPQP